MAEVLSPMIPRSDLAVPRLQNRSSPSPPSTPSQMPRSHNVGSGYRGTAAAPIAPYAFKTTPQLRSENRATSPIASPPASPLPPQSSSGTGYQRYPATSSLSSTTQTPSNPPMIGQLFLPKDDFDLMSGFNSGTSGMSFQETKPTAPPAPPAETAKKVPERYHRVHKQNASGSSGSVEDGGNEEESVVAEARDKLATTTLDDGQGNRPRSRPTSSRPESSHGGTAESEPFASAGQSENASGLATPKRYKRRTGSGDYGVAKPSSTTPSEAPQNTIKPFAPRADANSISSRTYSAADTARRMNNPSPLSRPLDLSEATSSPPSAGHAREDSQTSTTNVTQSPAIAAMAALNTGDKDPGKKGKSRLRRAFSFGSSQELKRASEADAAAERARARQERFSTELDEEQDAIARQQEAAGLGNSIYSGQGNIFQGSTDNLSISSTASSASLMLRKMGRGMKKGGRSIKGLFRPKSVIGVPAADEPAATIGSVSMVTVEAERQNVNVDLHPSRDHNGVDSYPRLERNSVDANRAAVPMQMPQNDRRAVIDGSDREALAAAKRGILKRAATDSPQDSPAFGPVDVDRTPRFSPSTERRPSPAPSATSSEPRQSRHRRTDSSTIDGDDYFTTLPRLQNNRSSRSLPGTPRSVRNITFSPRIQFHDVWSSQEYDRRGDIATCNRLTPLLAQQIKEELNNFKMEMEVHELSKPHTHFF